MKKRIVLFAVMSLLAVMSVSAQIFSLDSTDKVTVKNGHKLRIKKGSDGVRIWENFKCEKGAKFEIR
jgi:hypothetical protein